MDPITGSSSFPPPSSKLFPKYPPLRIKSHPMPPPACSGGSAGPSVIQLRTTISASEILRLAEMSAPLHHHLRFPTLPLPFPLLFLFLSFPFSNKSSATLSKSRHRTLLFCIGDAGLIDGESSIVDKLIAATVLIVFFGTGNSGEHRRQFARVGGGRRARVDRWRGYGYQRRQRHHHYDGWKNSKLRAYWIHSWSELLFWWFTWERRMTWFLNNLFFCGEEEQTMNFTSYGFYYSILYVSICHSA